MEGESSMERFIRRLQLALFFFAALWSVGAGLWLTLSPYTIEGIAATVIPGAAAETSTFSRQVSFYQVQGAWGIFVLFVFALLYSSGFYFFRRGRRWLATLGSVLALLLTFLAGYSVGPAYLPAAVAVMVALALILYTAIMPPGSAGPA
jgi:hypothetical protein